MTPQRCQICARRKPLRSNGTIVAHYVTGLPCPGAGYPPIEVTDTRLGELIVTAETEVARLARVIRDLEDRRANWIDPAIALHIGELRNQAEKLRRRQKRLDAWPRRFARDMERQGWGSPPPAYLAARYNGARHVH